MSKITSHKFLDLTKEQYDLVYKYSLKFGTMKEVIEELKRDQNCEYRSARFYSDALIHFLWDNTKFIGWSLTYGNTSTSVWVYVRPEYRKRGYGRQLVNRAGQGKEVKKIYIDRYNRKFWKAVLPNLVKSN